MRNYEFMLTFASGFAPRQTESAAGSVVKLRRRAQGSGQRDDRVALADREHVEGQERKLRRAAAVNRGS
jgi:hypothetical protein